MRGFLVVFALMLGALEVQAASFSETFPELGDIPAEAKTQLQRLDYKGGKITVGDGVATFDVGKSYYYLDPKDTKTVLEELWGNPPGGETLGMIFPAGMTPLHDNSWAVVLSYDAIGYVSDKEAANYDYDTLLSTMKADQVDTNKERKAQGYPEVDLIGWAAPPHYDQARRKLYWAREVAFSDSKEHTLNYEIRALGRKGVLDMTFVASLKQLPDVEAALPSFLAMSRFTTGNKYSDYVPSLDKVAAVGIGGLIAGKVVAKTGLLIGLLLVFKKFFFLALLPIIWLWRKVTGKTD